MNSEGIQQQVKIGAVHALMLQQRIALYHVLQPVQCVVEATLMAMSHHNNVPVTGDRVEAQVQAIVANAGAKRYQAKSLAKTLGVWEPEDSRMLMVELAEWIKAATVIPEKPSTDSGIFIPGSSSAAAKLAEKAGG